MSDNYAIQGIGYPMMSPLGTLGLGGAGTFSSYDYYMPSMLGMNGSVFNGGLGMMNPYMSMANPYSAMMNYPVYMAQMQEMMEARNADHVAYMHNKMKQNEVQAEKDTVSALVQKLLVQGDIQEQIVNLYTMVREGDQNGICQEYDKLKNYVYSEFSKEFAAKGGQGNARALVNHVIDTMYTNIVSQMAPGDGNLEEDIKKHGDGALMNGFQQGFHIDHHPMYVDETINHIKGTRIDHQGEHEVKQGIGKVAGFTAGTIVKGGGIGLGVATLAYGAKAIIQKSGSLQSFGKWGKWGALIGMGLYAAARLYHRISGEKATA